MTVPDVTTGRVAGRTPRVALVLVSHSADVAVGTATLARQMATDVAILPAGGLEDGGLGTSFALIARAVEQAAAGDRPVVVLTDLGSAVLTTESVLELAADDVAGRVLLVDAPFVEGAVAAAVAAAGGGGLSEVAEAAESAAASFARSGAPAPVASGPGSSAGSPGGRASTHASSPTVRGSVVLRNPLGLHARPAAQLARTAAEFDATVTVDGVDARSVLALIGLGATGGRELVVAASGPQARPAFVAVMDEIEAAFGEG
ncbi:dihydroxyacetone kinase phosphoryl donor subunit DhaM [Cellulomonas fimi]|uniref:Phosphocarrier protein HPr n=1 Tax=Cellulomonas fimi TaxID=1708 RepID=A0A7Y0LX53_CELFI|nr:dihydroxyacetone kinase phosphoryl donor subunit DhaM [Cellulomonas fimi]NMR19610.1 PTS-dependent dihydroxyacetone kinase phosphotransferase subunit DhaM [Cellulomonas fimi]